MEKTQAALDTVEAALADADLYTDEARKDELNAQLAQRGELATRLEELEQQWLAAEEALERLEAELQAS